MQDPEQAIRLLSSARTSRGRVRTNNEDRIHLSSVGDTLLAIIADGMGGAAAGEEASRIAIETIVRGLTSELKNKQTSGTFDSAPFIDTVAQTVRSANAQIIQLAESQPQFKGMGTTLTLVMIHKKEAIVAHIGDSRAYLVDGNNGKIKQVTVDHSFVQALLDGGHITAEEAEDHPMRNVLYRALGQAAEIQVDITTGLHLHTRDRIVMCSDGLTLHVRPQEIAAAAVSDDDPDRISEQLINLANARGGEDNVSVIVILVDDPNEELVPDYPQFDHDEDDPTLPMTETFPVIIDPQAEPPISESDSGRFSISGGGTAEDDDTFKPQH